MSFFFLVAAVATPVEAVRPVPPPPLGGMILDPSPVLGAEISSTFECPNGPRLVTISNTDGKVIVKAMSSNGHRANKTVLDEVNRRLEPMRLIYSVSFECSDGMVFEIHQHGRVGSSLRKVTVYWNPGSPPRFLIVDERGPHG